MDDHFDLFPEMVTPFMKAWGENKWLIMALPFLLRVPSQQSNQISASMLIMIMTVFVAILHSSVKSLKRLLFGEALLFVTGFLTRDTNLTACISIMAAVFFVRLYLIRFVRNHHVASIMALLLSLSTTKKFEFNNSVCELCFLFVLIFLMKQ